MMAKTPPTSTTTASSTATATATTTPTAVTSIMIFFSLVARSWFKFLFPHYYLIIFGPKIATAAAFGTTHDILSNAIPPNDLWSIDQQLLQNTGLNKEKLMELFNSTDTNGDNMISIEEFKNAVLRNVQKIMELKHKNIQL